MELITAYKCTGPNGLAHYDKKTRYIVGQVLIHPNPDPPSTGECGQGLHVSEFLHQTLAYRQDRDIRQCEFFNVEFANDSIIKQGKDKIRVKKLFVKKQIDEKSEGISRGKLYTAIGYGAGYGYGYGAGAGYGAGYGDGDGYGYGTNI